MEEVAAWEELGTLHWLTADGAAIMQRVQLLPGSRAEVVLQIGVCSEEVEMSGEELV